MSGSAGAHYEDDYIRLTYGSSLIISVAMPPDNTNPNYIADYFDEESKPFRSKLAAIEDELKALVSSFAKPTGAGGLTLVPLSTAKDFIYGTVIEDTGQSQTKEERNHGKNYLVNSKWAVFVSESITVDEFRKLDFVIAVAQQVNRSALTAFAADLQTIFK